MKTFILTMFVSILRSNNSQKLEDIMRRDLEMNRKMAQKTTIVTYRKSKMTETDIHNENERLKIECKCNVQHLSNVGAFILTYDSSPRNRAKVLELDSSKEMGVDDEVVFIFDDQITYDDGNINQPQKNKRGWPPNDAHFPSQWALSNLINDADINIKAGWSEYLSDPIGASSNGPEVVVAVIDTGIDNNHPDLRNQIWNNPGEIPDNGIDDDGNGIIDDLFGADFTREIQNGNPIDRFGHGTHCAGIIAAEKNNGIGTAGVASVAGSKVKIMAVKGITDGGSGRLSGLLMSLNYAIGHGAKISSNSWGSNNSISDAAAKAWSHVLQNNPDHLFVASAGNDNQIVDNKNRRWTCGLEEPNLLCVASSTKKDTKSSFSNFGRSNVHVFAPGSRIYSTLPNTRYGIASGTSMACPHASGLAAMLITLRCGLSGQEIRILIENNVQVKPFYRDLVSSGGLIDVAKTIRALKKSGSKLIMSKSTQYNNILGLCHVLLRMIDFSDGLKGKPSMVKSFLSCIVGYNSRPIWWNQILFDKNNFALQNIHDEEISHDKDGLESYEDNEDPAWDTEMYVHNDVHSADKRHDKSKF